MSTLPPAPTLSPLPPASSLPIADLFERHLLGVPDDVQSFEIEALALSRFPAARWEAQPAEHGAAGAARLDPGVLRTSRHTVIRGPYAPVAADGSTLGFGPLVSMVYDVQCPRERGAAPYQGGGDRDGLARVFADGLPVREEWRVVSWLVAVARRLGGSVSFSVGDDRRSLTVPDPAVAVDVTIYSGVWLDPDAALSVCRATSPGASFSSLGTPWEGPPSTTGIIPALSDSPLTPEQLAALHDRADAFDVEAMANPPALSGYGVEVDLGRDGLVTVEVGGVQHVPLVLKGYPWAAEGAVTYLVRWTPEDLVDWQREVPSFDLRRSRTRAAGVVARLTRAVHGAVGGVVVDQDEFLLDPEDL